MPYTYTHPRPAVSCDVVAFTLRADDLAVLLVQRKDEPFKGGWALPGGFVNENESLERAAARELYEETGLSGVRLEQLGAFGDPGRDPRGHTITVAFVSFLVAEATLSAGDDAAAVEWKSLRSLSLDEAQAQAQAQAQARSVSPPARGREGARRSVSPRGEEPARLAFDHTKIIARAYRRLCKHLDDPVRDATFDLVPPRFTLAELKRLCEVILGRAISPATLRRHFVARGLVVPATTRPASKPAARLYRWNRR